MIIWMNKRKRETRLWLDWKPKPMVYTLWLINDLYEKRSIIPLLLSLMLLRLQGMSYFQSLPLPSQSGLVPIVTLFLRELFYNCVSLTPQIPIRSLIDRSTKKARRRRDVASESTNLHRYFMIYSTIIKHTERAKTGEDENCNRNCQGRFLSVSLLSVLPPLQEERGTNSSLLLFWWKRWLGKRMWW